uniref:Uncharacterized protein n=1 Tax=Arundo donax TaxID=35708 RepID=A0A0A9TNM5_ARUDO
MQRFLTLGEDDVGMLELPFFTLRAMDHGSAGLQVPSAAGVQVAFAAGATQLLAGVHGFSSPRWLLRADLSRFFAPPLLSAPPLLHATAPPLQS